MATAQSLLARAVKEAGESLSDLTAVLYQETEDDIDNREIIFTGMAADLPPREFNDGYGSANGPLVIAFSTRFVYVCVVYDGAEWMKAVPRHPEYASLIPRLGRE